MTTYLIDGSTELPESGDTGWGTTLNAAILSIDSRFTWSGGQATPDAVAASVITGTTLPATLVTSSLTSVGTLASLTVSGNATVAGLLTGATTFALVNTTATTVNFAGAATALNIGAGTGTTTVNNALVVTGDLTVNGTTTTVNSTTLTVDDKNIVLADTASPTDVGADGGGITLKGTTDKTLNWVDATDAWTSSEHLNLAAGKAFYISGAGVLSSTTLGSGVTGSSLTSVGTIATGVWNGTVVTGQYGGTGVANTGKTITLGGDLTTSGAFATTITATATTNVTLPTTGTLATLAGSETLTNKTLTSPSLTTPTLGVASATTINKVALTAPATGSTLTIADGKTFTASNTLTLTGTDSSSVAFGAGGTVAYTGGTLAQFAATTSSQIAGVISDETGSGALVFGTSPAITTSLTTGSTSFDLVNTTATTVNFAGAATALNIGAATGATTINNVLTVVGRQSGGSQITTSGGIYGTLFIQPNDVTGSGNQSAPYISLAGADAVGTGVVAGGPAALYGGSASGGTTNNGGNASIDGGYGSTASGTVLIGNAYASAVSIGRSAITTTVAGALTVSGTTVLGPASIATQATARTLTLADQGKVVDMTNSSDAALTIPPNSSVAFPIGTQILVIRNGTGKVSFTPGAGVTLRSDSSKQFISTQYSAATLVQRAADEWYLIGNLAAS